MSVRKSSQNSATQGSVARSSVAQGSNTQSAREKFGRVSDNQTLPPHLRKSIALILMGNFLEYFDLMLGVHLAIVLNGIFLPSSTEYGHLLRPVTFLLPLCMRPFAALVWGYVGDRYGRKLVLTSTMLVMGVCCIVITLVPTYLQWGMSSTIVFFTIRSLQSFVSAAETGGARVYISEVVPVPKVYFTGSLISLTATLGGLFACLIGSLCITLDPTTGWKYCFIIGASIAVIGSHARRDIKETPEFLSFYHARIADKVVNTARGDFLRKHAVRNSISLVLVYVLTGFSFYFCFSYVPLLLEKKFNFTSAHILLSSSFALFLTAIVDIVSGLLALKIHPRKIFAVSSAICLVACVVLSMQGWLLNSWLSLLAVQWIVITFSNEIAAIFPMYVRNFPISSRCRYDLWTWALSKTAVYLFTAYVCVKINNINILLFIMAVGAAISVGGVYLFTSYEDGNDAESDLDAEEDSADSYLTAHMEWQKGRN